MFKMTLKEIRDIYYNDKIACGTHDVIKKFKNYSSKFQSLGSYKLEEINNEVFTRWKKEICSCYKPEYTIKMTRLVRTLMQYYIDNIEVNPKVARNIGELNVNVDGYEVHSAKNIISNFSIFDYIDTLNYSQMYKNSYMSIEDYRDLITMLSYIPAQYNSIMPLTRKSFFVNDEKKYFVRVEKVFDERTNCEKELEYPNRGVFLIPKEVYDAAMSIADRNNLADNEPLAMFKYDKPLPRKRLSTVLIKQNEYLVQEDFMVPDEIMKATPRDWYYTAVNRNFSQFVGYDLNITSNGVSSSTLIRINFEKQ